MTTEVKQIYVQSLKNTRAAEQQGLQQLERQIERMERYPDYIALVREHIEVTKLQLDRIEAALSDTGSDVGTLREAVTGAAGNIGAAVHAVMPDETLKNLYAGYAYQHEQIAAYQSLAVIADAAGYGQHREWIETTLEEERRGAEAAENLIAPVTRKFLELEMAEA